jgi:NifU-like protein involved in Fe-S cluster formation
MAAATTLYSQPVLALATSLSDWPWDQALPMQATVRSKSCGSTLALGVSLDSGGCIARLGMKAQACAIGQAAAAIFAQAAPGRNAADIEIAARELAAWLAGEGPMPDWPELELLDPARAYPARHAAILLAWQAARQLLPTGEMPR